MFSFLILVMFNLISVVYSFIKDITNNNYKQFMKLCVQSNMSCQPGFEWWGCQPGFEWWGCQPGFEWWGCQFWNVCQKVYYVGICQ